LSFLGGLPIPIKPPLSKRRITDLNFSLRIFLKNPSTFKEKMERRGALISLFSPFYKSFRLWPSESEIKKRSTGWPKID